MDLIKKDGPILDTFSPATKYESLMVKYSGSGPSEDKAIILFQVLDQIIPHLGVFTKVMQMCRDDIFEALYSDQYTSTAEGEDKKYIQRVPYFCLVQRDVGQKTEETQQLECELQRTNDRLRAKTEQVQRATDELRHLSEEMDVLKTTIGAKESDIIDHKQTIESLEKSTTAEREDAHGRERDLEADISELQEDLLEARKENDLLRQYKLGYNNLKQAFHERSTLEDIAPKKKKKTALATKKAHLLSEIDNCFTFEDQIRRVQNAIIEEFEKFLEQHKSELSEKTAEPSQTEIYTLQEIEIDRADQQLYLKQENFAKSMQDLGRELGLLRQQRLGLQEQLQGTGRRKATQKRQKPDKSRTQESGLPQGLEEPDEEDTSMGPFTIQERIFSKYAAMVYASHDGGQTFHELKTAAFCQSCGEKTVLCPHKLLQQEHVFALPRAATHIKVTRPRVRINRDKLDPIFQPVISPSPRPDVSQGSALVSRDTPLEGSPSIPPSVTPDSLIPLRHSTQRLWDDYRQRTQQERAVARPLSSEHVLSLVEQFVAYLVCLEELPAVDKPVAHILDRLYEFFFDRYVESEAVYNTAFDFLTSLVEFANCNKMLWLVCQTLLGNLDSTALRYVLLLADVINAIQWREVEDVRALARLLYPWLTEDDLENFQMGYTSFSANRVSSSLVAEYLIHVLMRGREPRFLEMENHLQSGPHGNLDDMTEPQFVDTLDTILSLPGDDVITFYREAMAYVTAVEGATNTLPLTTLAQITSYLSLLEVHPLLKDGGATAVENARMTSAADGALKQSRAVPAKFEIFGMTSVKLLAANIARRRHKRTTRIQRSQDAN